MFTTTPIRKSSRRAFRRSKKDVNMRLVAFGFSILLAAAPMGVRAQAPTGTTDCRELAQRMSKAPRLERSNPVWFALGGCGAQGAEAVATALRTISTSRDTAELANYHRFSWLIMNETLLDVLLDIAEAHAASPEARALAVLGLGAIGSPPTRYRLADAERADAYDTPRCLLHASAFDHGGESFRSKISEAALIRARLVLERLRNDRKTPPLVRRAAYCPLNLGSEK